MTDKIRVEMELVDGQFVQSVKRVEKTVDRIADQFDEMSRNMGAAARATKQAGASLRSFDQGARQASSGMQQLNRRSKSFLATMRDVSVVVGAASIAVGKFQNSGSTWVGQIVGINAEFERLNVLMQGLSTASDPVADAGDKVKYLQQMAKQTPFQLQAITDSFTKMKATGIDPLDGSLRAFTDAVAAAGGGDEMLKRVSIAISQMSGKGVVQMEELRQQLGEAIPRATELMARSMGVSYSELVAALSTGRVEAKAALSSLRDELLRTFGGSGQRMMDTFNGMLSKTRTQLQVLALETGNAGFFDEMKRQMSDLNTFLESESAAAMARSFGQALTSIVQSIREVIDWTLRFRDEIKLLAQVLAISFGTSIAVRAIAGITSGLVAATAATKQFAKASMMLAAGKGFAATAESIGLISGSAAGVGKATTAVRGLSGALALAGGVAGTLGPAIAVLGSVLVTASYAFDVFGSRARGAVQEMEEFGATSLAQVEKARPAMDAMRDEMMEQIDRMSYFESKVANATGLTANFLVVGWREKAEEARAEANRLNDELTELNKKMEGWEDQAIDFQASQNSNNDLRAVRNNLAKMRLEYDVAAREEVKRVDEAKKKALEGNRDTQRLTDEHNKNMAKLRAQNSASILAELDKQITANIERRKSNNAMEVAIAERNLAQLFQMQKQEEAIAKSRAPAGIQLTAETSNLDKALQKATTIQDRLNAEAAEYRAELIGVNGEAARLEYILREAAGAGPLDNQALQEQINQIIAAQEEVTKLQEMVEGRAKFERDLDRQLQNSREELFEAQNQGLTDWEKFLKRVNEGYYPGASKSDMEKMVDGIRKSMDDAGRAGTRAADAIQNSLFGAFMSERAKNFLGVIGQMVNKFAEMRGVINGISLQSITSGFDGLTGFNGGGASGGAPFASGNVPTPGDGYYSTLIGRESGGNPNAKAKTSSATGLGQFIESTWMDFIKSTRPEMMNMMSRGQILGMRKDPGMSMEAIKWLTGKNAGALSRSGLSANDANLYLAHLLGSGDAIKVLRSGANTQLEGLVSQASVNANRSILGNGRTVGDLMRSITKQFGTGFTAGVQGGQRSFTDVYYPGSRVEMPKDLTAEDRQVMEETEENYKRAAKIMADNKLADSLKEANLIVKNIREEVEGIGQNEAEMIKKIRGGEFGANTDPQSERYKELLKLMQDMDREEQRLADKRKLRSERNNLKDQTEELKERVKRAERDMANVSTSEYMPSNAFYQLETRWNEYLRNVESIHSKESQIYKQGLIDKKAALDTFKNAEIMGLSTQSARQAEERRVSMMSESEQRRYTLQKQIEYNQSLLANFQGTEQQRVEIARQTEEAIRQLRRESSMSGPLGRQMQQWADFGSNMEQAMTGWLDGGIDAIANFVATGKADFKSLAQSIIKDMTKIALKWAVSKMFSGFGGDGAEGAKGSKGAKTGGLGMIGKLFGFGIAHTGGIAGGSLARKMASPMAFAGAPRFHTGGIIKGMGIGPDEVPIIAKKGEGVFTAEQMKAMGSMGGQVNNQAISLNTNVNVNASGGTPEQNQDLAARVGKQVEGSVRQMVVKELMVQRRPGGLLGQK